MEAYSLTFNRHLSITGLPEERMTLGDTFYVAIDHNTRQIIVRNTKGNYVLQWFPELGSACSHASHLARQWGYTTVVLNMDMGV